MVRSPRTLLNYNPANAMPRSLKQELVGEQVRMLRRRAGITLRGLAAQSGFSPSFISELENGQVSPSINSMERLGRILGVGLAEFFAGTGGANGAQLVRARDRPQAQSLWSQARIEILATGGSRHDLQPVVITLEPGGRSGKHPTAPGREEFMFVLEGELIVTVGPDQLMVRPGDALIVRPREVRRYENPGPASARILVVSGGLPAPETAATASRAPRRRAPRARALPTRRT
jgi:transcriptional regulator with XRE-family HTH domain